MKLQLNKISLKFMLQWKNHYWNVTLPNLIYFPPLDWPCNCWLFPDKYWWYQLHTLQLPSLWTSHNCWGEALSNANNFLTPLFFFIKLILLILELNELMPCFHYQLQQPFSFQYHNHLNRIFVPYDVFNITREDGKCLQRPSGDNVPFVVINRQDQTYKHCHPEKKPTQDWF